MSCKFCAKGKAQNLDISTEIIDKIIDEMKDTYIDVLRISGGEPFLAQESICYLIKKIMESHVLINSAVVFTNGYITGNSELCSCMLDFLDYLRKIETEIRPLIRWSATNQWHKYVGSPESKVCFIISDVGRKVDTQRLNSQIDFFRDNICDDDFNIVLQSDSFDEFGQIVLEGNAADNYRDLLGKSVDVSDIRILSNDYHFVRKARDLKSNKLLKDTTFITKTLSVSSNGNVFPGCMMSYEHIDKYPMFNVLECCGDFLDRVNDYCWQHPISKRAMRMRNIFAGVQFCRERGITVKDLNPFEYARLEMLKGFADRCEQIAKDLHSIQPDLGFVDVDGMATATLALTMFNEKISPELIKYCLKYCADYDDYTLSIISAEWCRGFIKYISDKSQQHN